MSIRKPWFVAAFAAVMAANAVIFHAQAQPQALHVCADPNYFPYSNRAGQGFENKIAEVVAHAMGRPIAYTWASIRGEDGFDEMVRTDLDTGKCDLIVDVPYAAQNVQTTHPYYISSYVFIYKKAAGYDLASLDSPVLRTLKIGYEAETPAQEGLKLRALIIGAKPFLSAEEENPNPASIVDALEANRINVGITWDPAIAYYVAQHPDLTTVVVPNSRSTGTPEQYSFPMSMATSEKNQQFTNQLNGIIAAHRSELQAVLRQYHIRFFAPGEST